MQNKCQLYVTESDDWIIPFLGLAKKKLVLLKLKLLPTLNITNDFVVTPKIYGSVLIDLKLDGRWNFNQYGYIII